MNKPAINLALMRKQAGFWEWSGENVIGPVSSGIGKFYSKKKSKDTDYEDIGENVVAPLLRGVDKNLDLSGSIKQQVTKNVPVATAAAGSQILDWLKSKGKGWESLYGGGIDKLKGISPEGLQPLLDKLKEHPYLTPALAAALPMLLLKIRGNAEEKGHRKRVELALNARPIKRFL